MPVVAVRCGFLKKNKMWNNLTYFENQLLLKKKKEKNYKVAFFIRPEPEWGTSSSQTVTLGMCAILHDKYQWFAPGFRLWLTGSHGLSRFTQMETILSQRSHKNQSGSFSFCFSHLLFIVCRQWRSFTVLLGGRQHLYLFAGCLWDNFKFHMNLQLHTWVSLNKSNSLSHVSHTPMIQTFKTLIQDSRFNHVDLSCGFHIFEFCAPNSDDVTRWNLHCGYQQLVFWPKVFTWCALGWVP